MIKVINLLNGEELSFDANTEHEYALAYAYSSENKLMPSLFYHVHNNSLNEFYQGIPKFCYGKKTIGLDNWATLKQ